MRAVFATLVTFFALTYAWSPSLTRLTLNTGSGQTDFAALQRYVSSADEAPPQHDLAATYKEVPIPPPQTYVLGPPKFPQAIISGSSAPYCNQTLSAFNQTCASQCSGMR